MCENLLAYWRGLLVPPDDSGLYANEVRGVTPSHPAPPSVDLVGRLPAASLFLPPQPAHGPPHGGDRDPLPLLDLRELPPQGAALVGGGDGRPTTGGTRGAYLSGRSP